MSARNLLRQVFRHAPRDKVGGDALPLGLWQTIAGATVDNKHEAALSENKQRATTRTFTPAPKTPEPFGLEDIAEEAVVDTPSSIDTASLTESIPSVDLGISSYSTRELVQATLEEAKTAASSHLETIGTTLALLDALEGFSATISEMRKEMLGKKEACEEQLGMLEAVERAVESMVFAGELQDQDVGYENEQ